MAATFRTVKGLQGTTFSIKVYDGQPFKPNLRIAAKTGGNAWNLPEFMVTVVELVCFRGVYSGVTDTGRTVDIGGGAKKMWIEV